MLCFKSILSFLQGCFRIFLWEFEGCLKGVNLLVDSFCHLLFDAFHNAFAYCKGRCQKNSIIGGTVPIWRSSGSGCKSPPFLPVPIWTPPKCNNSVPPFKTDFTGEILEEENFVQKKSSISVLLCIS